jgi:hypothetical protein
MQGKAAKLPVRNNNGGRGMNMLFIRILLSDE